MQFGIENNANLLGSRLQIDLPQQPHQQFSFGGAQAVGGGIFQFANGAFGLGHQGGTGVVRCRPTARQPIFLLFNQEQ